MEASEYAQNPCWTSSLPFWKTNCVLIPENMRILRDDIYKAGKYSGTDEPYFKLQHDLSHIPSVQLAPAYQVVDLNINRFAQHINECYDQERISAEELTQYTTHSTYDSSLWLCVAEKETQRVVASGIAELDTSIGEGILEWIQVSPAFRRQALGKWIVCELLRRMKKRAQFATVSGRINNATRPYALYCSCGFENPVIWHVLTLQ